MTWLVWIGTALALTGLTALAYCIYAAVRAKREGLPDHEMRDRLQQLVGINMGALLMSVLGLMSVVLGIFLA